MAITYLPFAVPIPSPIRSFYGNPNTKDLRQKTTRSRAIVSCDNVLDHQVLRMHELIRLSPTVLCIVKFVTTSSDCAFLAAIRPRPRTVLDYYSESLLWCKNERT